MHFEVFQARIDALRDQFTTVYPSAEVASSAVLGLTSSNQTSPIGPMPPAQDAPQQTRPLQSQLKLQNIQLPRFSGEPADWPSFRDMFVHHVHNQTSLSGCSKLQLLMHQLDADAQMLLQGLPISDASYVTAWDLLQRTYEQAGTLAAAYVRRVVNLPRGMDDDGAMMTHHASVCRASLRQLQNLGGSAVGCDPWVLHVLLHRQGPQTRAAWSQQQGVGTVPSIESFLDFLAARGAQTLAARQTDDEIYATAAVATAGRRPTKDQAPPRRQQVAQTPVPTSSNGKAGGTAQKTARERCKFCGKSHQLMSCSEFYTKSLADRRRYVSDQGLCFNCLKSGHAAQACPCDYSCRKCKGRHHTLLHSSDLAAQTVSAPTVATTSNAQVLAATVLPPQSTIVKEADSLLPSAVAAPICERTAPQPIGALMTARVRVNDQIARVLLDSRSQVTLVSKSFLQRLSPALAVQRCHPPLRVGGLWGASGQPVRCDQTVSIELRPRASHSVARPVNVSAYVVDSLVSLPATAHMPVSFTASTLADDRWYAPGDVDILVGSRDFWTALAPAQLYPDNESPAAVLTSFGWVLLPNVDIPAAVLAASTTICDNDDYAIATLPEITPANAQATRFWAIEAVRDATPLTSLEQYAKQHFASTISWRPGQRAVVQLPLRVALTALADTRNLALRRLHSVQRRLQREPETQIRYNDFILEFLRLGHAERVPTGQLEDPVYFIPHHHVIREASSSTKLRVVFDANAKTPSGPSLNEALAVGRVDQAPLVDILLRFRCHRIALSADVTKMFRCVDIDRSQCDAQRIWWQFAPQEPPVQLRLLTVTYGTSCAPYLATSAINHLAASLEHSDPLTAATIRRSFYMDNLLAGADSIDEACALQCKISAALQSLCMPLRKWASNTPEALKGLPSDHCDPAAHSLYDDEHDVGALGFRWCPHDDTLQIRAWLGESVEHTKRTLLSEVMRIFDPLGLLAPLTIKFRILFQRVWQFEDSGWESPLPPNLQKEWLDLRNDVQALSRFKLPCWLNLSTSSALEIHGFCNASTVAYGAAVYVREIKTCRTTLLLARGRVAPLRPFTVPRLELLGATLLSTLLVDALRALTPLYGSLSVTAWTDSTILLAWLNHAPSSFGTFVGNRLAHIHDQVPQATWRHITTDANPADHLSRGLSASDLTATALWWNGPDWFSQPSDTWPTSAVVLPARHLLPEIKSSVARPPSPPTIALETALDPSFALTAATMTEDLDAEFPRAKVESTAVLRQLLDNASTLTHAQRVTAWVRRFLKRLFRTTQFFNAQSPINNDDSTQPDSNDQLTPDELDAALVALVRAAQSTLHPQLHSKRWRRLLPFVDDQRLIRADSRIVHAQFLRYDTRYPLLLDNRSRLVRLLCEDAHHKLLHAQATLIVTHLRCRFYFPAIRRTAQSAVHACVVCRRRLSFASRPQMAPLPQQRLVGGYPFASTGVDLCGPFRIMRWRAGTLASNDNNSISSYVALFCCLSSRAVHLEPLFDMSTESFLALLRRFVARRGLPAEIWSDNGSNFLGAARRLHADQVAAMGVRWNHIPARAPSFGGAWESLVRAIKRHMTPVLTQHRFTIEEWYTLLAQVEALVNTSPLLAETGGLAAPAPLTPAHALIGRSFFNLPIAATMDHPRALWTTVQLARDAFWSRWSAEYLTQLLQRASRPASSAGAPASVRPGDVVYITNTDVKPAFWPLGIVQQIKPGRDGIVRVVRVRTAQGDYDYAVIRLIVLYQAPTDSAERAASPPPAPNVPTP